MPFLIQTDLEKFQFNRSRPVSEPVWNQFPSVCFSFTLPPPFQLSLFLLLCFCREFMKRGIRTPLKKNLQKKDKKRRTEDGWARTIKSDAPPVHGGNRLEQRNERQSFKGGKGGQNGGSYSRDQRKRSTWRKLPSIGRPWTRSYRKKKHGEKENGCRRERRRAIRRE